LGRLCCCRKRKENRHEITGGERGKTVLAKEGRRLVILVGEKRKGNSFCPGGENGKKMGNLRGEGGGGRPGRGRSNREWNKEHIRRKSGARGRTEEEGHLTVRKRKKGGQVKW